MGLKGSPPRTRAAKNALVRSDPSTPAAFDWRSQADEFFGRLLYSRQKPGASASSLSSSPTRPSSSFSSFIHHFILLSAGIFVLLLLLAILSPLFLPPPSWSVEVSEAPLHKKRAAGP
ncbi:MAG: hypothetical protein M1530_00710, partial [Candidatus Marsarchaeota archaeon]|nr:hypothetical protein [Candidatus Marsarchaeota archaeon]